MLICTEEEEEEQQQQQEEEEQEEFTKPSTLPPSQQHEGGQRYFWLKSHRSQIRGRSLCSTNRPIGPETPPQRDAWTGSERRPTVPSPSSSFSHLVGLVEDHPDLVVLSFEGSDGFGELVRDVQLVGVEQQNDPIHALPEPTQHLRENKATGFLLL
ncbi:hypothetical protein EYF80_042206 [Liparis tanakae]|uniref:Uncharacterized protein n=1 Tax=Liparis tanakae TaxID=230148 RepID=A0A4Z2G404_9TELE|nr:hypothetical protein EYF80_042206 [Liparis tanakae]